MFQSNKIAILGASLAIVFLLSGLSWSHPFFAGWIIVIAELAIIIVTYKRFGQKGMCRLAAICIAVPAVLVFMGLSFFRYSNLDSWLIILASSGPPIAAVCLLSLKSKWGYIGAALVSPVALIGTCFFLAANYLYGPYLLSGLPVSKELNRVAFKNCDVVADVRLPNSANQHLVISRIEKLASGQERRQDLDWLFIYDPKQPVTLKNHNDEFIHWSNGLNSGTVSILDGRSLENPVERPGCISPYLI